MIGSGLEMEIEAHLTISRYFSLGGISIGERTDIDNCFPVVLVLCLSLNLAILLTFLKVLAGLLRLHMVALDCN